MTNENTRKGRRAGRPAERHEGSTESKVPNEGKGQTEKSKKPLTYQKVKGILKLTFLEIRMAEELKLTPEMILRMEKRSEAWKDPAALRIRRLYVKEYRKDLTEGLSKGVRRKRNELTGLGLTEAERTMALYLRYTKEELLKLKLKGPELPLYIHRDYSAATERSYGLRLDELRALGKDKPRELYRREETFIRKEQTLSKG